MGALKKGEIRKNEIMDAAESLFIEKGYTYTTINDILNATGIAKGLLYYYFESKEDILDDIIKRHGDVLVEAASIVMETEGLDAREKLLRVMLSQKPADERQSKLISDLQKSSNGHMFLKSLTDIILRLAPILGDIVEQGIAEGEFSTHYPKESAEILLAAAHSLFDNANFRWTPEEQIKKISAFICAAERILGTEEGALLKMIALFE